MRLTRSTPLCVKDICISPKGRLFTTHLASTLTCLLRPLHHLRTHAHAQALLTLNGQLYVRVHDG